MREDTNILCTFEFWQRGFILNKYLYVSFLIFLVTIRKRNKDKDNAKDKVINKMNYPATDNQRKESTEEDRRGNMK